VSFWEKATWKKDDDYWTDIFQMDIMEIGCEYGRWMELAQDRLQWHALVLAVLNLRVLLPQFWGDRL
jgi:hypothetical protein